MSARDMAIRFLDTLPVLWTLDKQSDRLLSALCAMPEADRLAFARELAGDGFAVVPKKATQKMMQAAARLPDPTWQEIYAAMLTAAQEPTR